MLQYSKRREFDLRIDKQVINSVLLSNNYYIIEPLIKNHVQLSETSDYRVTKTNHKHEDITLVLVKYFKVSECIRYLFKMFTENNKPLDKQKSNHVFQFVLNLQHVADIDESAKVLCELNLFEPFISNMKEYEN